MNGENRDKVGLRSLSYSGLGGSEQTDCKG